MGHGWVSDISLGDAPSVMAEVNTRWLNPQNVISDGTFIYVSCSGTIDFLPPAYNAIALDTGGVQVISASTREIVASYELGKCGPGPMALSPDKRFLYVGSAVAGGLLRLDLEQRKVLNDASNPIVISDFPGTYVPFVEVTPEGLLICASFNTDTIRFVDSWTGEVDPFPFFGPIELHPDDPDLFYGIQDAAVCRRDGRKGLLILTTVDSAFHWLPL
jgi:DNA-binding beta-propeller fold protein YncE